jgi:hypothetical protein
MRKDKRDVVSSIMGKLGAYIILIEKRQGDILLGSLRRCY